MSTLTINLGKYTTSNSSWTVTGTQMPTATTPAVYTYTSPSTGSKITGTLRTSNIPQYATINKVTLSYSRSRNRSGSADSTQWIYNGNNTRATGDNIKKWLNSKKSSDGLYPDFQLYFQIKASYGQKLDSGDFLGTRTYSLNDTYNNIILTVDYTEAADLNVASPTIESLEVKDSSKPEDACKVGTVKNVVGQIKTGLAERPTEVVIAKTGKMTNYSINCLQKNYSSLRIGGSAISQQPITKTVKYNLVIKRKNDDSVFFEMLGQSSGEFTVPKELFSAEDVQTLGSAISEYGYKCIPYDFYYTAYDVANLGTQITGKFYLFDNYTPPTLTNFSVTRADFKQNAEGTGYVPFSSPDAPYLSTTLRLAGVKIPTLVTENAGTLTADQFNLLTYTKKVENDDTGETSGFDGSTPTTAGISTDSAGNPYMNLTDDFSFLGGALISTEGKPDYQYKYDGATSFTVTLEIQDVFSRIIQSIKVPPAFSYFNIELTGVSVGERHSDGSEENPTFTVNLPTTIKKQLLLLQQLVLTNGVTYGTALPDASTATEGQVYFKLI